MPHGVGGLSDLTPPNFFFIPPGLFLFALDVGSSSRKFCQKSKLPLTPNKK